LKLAQHHVSKNETERARKIAAADELLSYGIFTAAQIADWLGLGPWALEDKTEGRINSWGLGQLKAHQLPDAIALAESGLDGDKPKTMIYHAYKRSQMSFDMIGGLLGIHKNVVRRIVRRIEGEPWT
jgi:hypothetical protein